MSASWFAVRTPVSETTRSGPRWVVLGRLDAGISAISISGDGGVDERIQLSDAEFGEWVRHSEKALSPRWVWNDTPRWYPALLAAGVRIARCHDLRLNHLVLEASSFVRDRAPLQAASAWHMPPYESAPVDAPALFDWESGHVRPGPPSGADDAFEEFERQRQAISTSADPNRLAMLAAAESAGALVACELQAAGLPWSRAAHEELLDKVLGERDASTGVHQRVFTLASEVRQLLGDPTLSVDSPPKLLRGLHRAGILVTSTSRWELAEQTHPAIEPLLEYKKLTRLLSANGRAWLDEWVADGRFRPVYIPSGVVTGRWASSGGGALQIPRQLRSAVRADPGWKLVVADVAQLEPRVLAAMSADPALAAAAYGRDLYCGIVDAGAVATRPEAKLAMLGAMYGSTSGESGRLVPRLRRTYPRAMGLVDAAAHSGEDGGVVSTWLGRTCAPPTHGWAQAQLEASQSATSEAEVSQARRSARERGRFTRNYVVQGTAAEWALAWLGDLRSRLAALPPVSDANAASASGPVFANQAHLAFFLHDEVIVHAPESQAEAAADAARDAATAAGRLLFGGFRLDFPLDVRISDTAAKD
ncbi:bifunctional 3'-5' exonuclease/DNA polymerase (plasmid) [Coraliomargarita sp. W4R53]